MHLIPRLLTFCCALVAASSGMAASLPDLYKVREAVATQQPSEREEALRQAFDTLLLRLTGDTDTQNKNVAQLRQDPQQLISKYVYEEGAVVVDFDPLTTERALRSAGLSLWGAERPGIRSEEHTSELQSRENLVCRLLLEKKKDSITIQWC